MAAYQCLNCQQIETSALEPCCDKEDLFCINDMPGEILRLRAELAARTAQAAPALTFSVAVVAQRASNGTTHNVSIYRSDRPANAKPWDDGVVTPCNRNNVDEANQEGAEWAKFLGAPFTPGTADAEPIAFPSRVPEYGGSVVPRGESDGAKHAELWRDMSTAPKDGTILRLLVEFDDHALEDTVEPVATIGGNSFANTGVDEWQFAGWNWSQDHFTDGVGRPIGWLPLLGGDAVPSKGTEKVADVIPPAVFDKLQSLQVGGCTCLTKTPEVRFHDTRCTYRLASEIVDLLCTSPAPGTVRFDIPAADCFVWDGAPQYPMVTCMDCKATDYGVTRLDHKPGCRVAAALGAPSANAPSTGD